MLCRNVYTALEGNIYWGVLQATVSLSEDCVFLMVYYKCNNVHCIILYITFSQQHMSFDSWQRIDVSVVPKQLCFFKKN